MSETPRRPAGDRGSILILTLVLTMVLSLVVIGLARYTMAGLATSDVSTERTERTAAATAGIYFVVEQLSVSAPAGCPAQQVLASSVVPGDVAVSVACSKVTTTESPAIYELVARTTDGHIAGQISVSVQVRTEMSSPRSVRVVEWDGNDV